MSADGAWWEVRRAGAHGLLVQCSHLDDVLALHAGLAADPLPGQLEALAAARTVLLRFVSASDARRAVPALESCGTEPAAPAEAKQVEIDVVYDGEDLGEVARHTGLTVDAVIAAHTASAWAGAFGGFAPGFAYLTGGDPRLEVPRRTTPRTAVPAGAVGLAGEFSAVYPRRSPGGWQLIGRTAAAMWDLDRDPPALVRPGDRVRFRAVRELVRVSDADGDTVSDVAGVSAPPAGPALLIEDPGPRALLQDRGRGGHGDLGVSLAGAADRASAAEAQELLGNDPGAALVEITLGGLRARARGDLVLALTGAPLEARILRDDDEDPPEHEGDSDLQDQPVAMGRPIALHDGEVLHLGIPDRGVRTYLAVRGGFDVAPVLGSCSTDTLSGLGPPPLTGGTELPVADPDRAGAVAMHASPSARTCPGAGETTVLRVLPGPREDWFEQTALDLLTGQEWQVTGQSDRIGLRLTPLEGGTVLTRSRTDELPSEGVVSGALQVPTSGEPVLFLADHPTTGGYPVIAVLHIDDIPLAAQLPPGARTRFTLEAA